MSTNGQRRPRFASQRARHRRRRRVALVVLVVAVAVPTLALTAFRGSDSSSAPAAGRFAGGKIAPHAVKSSALVSAARQRAAVARLYKLGLPIYCAGPTGRYVGFTFDDGPSELTPKFLALLRTAGARATFFIVGANMTSPTLAAFARQDAKLGAVGDHTWLHVDLTKLSEQGVVDEVGKAKKAIRDATGAPVLLFRPPYAARNDTVARVVHSQGMVQILWNTDSLDWAGGGWKKIGDNVALGLRPGSIIIMHDSISKAETLKALQYAILPELKLRGLQAVSLPELFALDPPSEQQVRADAAAGACLRGQHG